MLYGQIIGNCQSAAVLSGRGACEVKPGKTKRLLLTPTDANYAMDKDNFIDEIQQAVIASPAERVIPVGPLSGNDPTGGDLATSDAGNYGGTVTVGVNPTSVSYQIDQATPCQYMELSKLNGTTMRIFHFDDNGYIFGTGKVIDNAVRLIGYLGTIYVREVEATGTTPYQVFINIDYSVDYESEKKVRQGFYLGAGNLPEGLIGIILKAGTAAGIASVITSCGGQDITEKYGEEWSADMFVTEAGAVPTTVTYANGVITLAPAGAYKINSASVLAAGDVLGYEGINQYTSIAA